MTHIQRQNHWMARIQWQKPLGDLHLMAKPLDGSHSMAKPLDDLHSMAKPFSICTIKQHSHLLNHLWGLTFSGYLLTVCVCVCMCVCVCSRKFVWTFFVMGYVLRSGERAHKRVTLLSSLTRPKSSSLVSRARFINSGFIAER